MLLHVYKIPLSFTKIQRYSVCQTRKAAPPWAVGVWMNLRASVNNWFGSCSWTSVVQCIQMLGILLCVYKRLAWYFWNSICRFIYHENIKDLTCQLSHFFPDLNSFCTLWISHTKQIPPDLLFYCEVLSVRRYIVEGMNNINCRFGKKFISVFFP